MQVWSSVIAGKMTRYVEMVNRKGQTMINSMPIVKTGFEEAMIDVPDTTFISHEIDQ